jgi:tetratricopeptide (TPR) repeat protein
MSTPESVRAKNQIVHILIEQRRMEEALAYLEGAAGKFKDSSFLTVNLLYLKVYMEIAQEKDFIKTAKLLGVQPFDAQTIGSLRDLVDKLVDTEGNISYVGYTIALLDNVYAKDEFKNVYTFKKLYFYCKGRLYLKLNKYDAALENYATAMKLYSETDAALSMVAEMGNQNRPKEALILLAQAELVYKNQNILSLQRSRQLYDKEFFRMRVNLEQLDKFNRESDALETSKVDQ